MTTTKVKYHYQWVEYSNHDKSCDICCHNNPTCKSVPHHQTSPKFPPFSPHNPRTVLLLPSLPVALLLLFHLSVFLVAVIICCFCCHGCWWLLQFKMHFCCQSVGSKVLICPNPSCHSIGISCQCWWGITGGTKQISCPHETSVIQQDNTCHGVDNIHIVHSLEELCLSMQIQ